MLFIYDNSTKPSSDISSYIGQVSFSDVLVRTKALGIIVNDAVSESGVSQYLQLDNVTQKEQLLLDLSTKYQGTRVIYLSSEIAPLDIEKFKVFVLKMVNTSSNYVVSDFQGLASAGCSDFIKGVLNGDLSGGDYVLLEREQYFIDLRDYSNLITLMHSNVHSRHFNELNSTKFSITKKSRDVEKIHNEYWLMSSLPDSLKRFFVTPYDYKVNDGLASYQLERINVPDMAIQALNRSITKPQFDDFLEHIDLYLSFRGQHSIRHTEQKGADRGSSRFLYRDKLMARLAEFKQAEGYKSVEVFIAWHTNYSGIDNILEAYLTEFEKVEKRMMAEDKLVVSHGDLCLSNILYSKETKLLKFIDPRGSSDKSGMYFDPLYDIVKLSHSILGDYDSIVNGLVDITFDDSMKASLTMKRSVSNENKTSFISFLERQGYRVDLIRLLECSLFISMLPLHLDNLNKVTCLALQATKILDDVRSSCDYL
jgi:hypothetical protein